VHTKELLNQWFDRIEQFLEIPGSDIGIIGAGKFKIGDKVTVVPQEGGEYIHYPRSCISNTEQKYFSFDFMRLISISRSLVFHPKGVSIFSKKCSVLEAARGAQFYRIYCVFRT
jgi:hypothetical protein